MNPTRSLPLLLALAFAGALVAACGSSKKPSGPSDPNPPPPPTPCAQVSDCPDVACQTASCTGGACAYLDAAVSSTCDDGQGGRFCDGNGACVQCFDPVDCGSLDVCTQRVECNAGRCDRFYYAGDPPSGPVPQTPNDCITLRCDGTSGLVPNFDHNDLTTTTANSCTFMDCYVDSQLHEPLVVATIEQPFAIGTPCPGGVCDPAGVCSTVP